MSERLRVVVNGVSGSGKTTVGERVAARLDAGYIDADSAHSQANIDKMSAGVPLTDDDRWPWVDRLRDALASSDRIVVTCSALTVPYRNRLREADGVTFVYLDVDRATVLERVGGRVGHFMKADMVASQFATLEPPTDDEPDVIVVDGRLPIADLVDLIVGRIDGAAS
ncbi:MAG: gluconokinase [Ilumatobacteraceae bacterium]